MFIPEMLLLIYASELLPSVFTEGVTRIPLFVEFTVTVLLSKVFVLGMIFKEESVLVEFTFSSVLLIILVTEDILMALNDEVILRTEVGVAIGDVVTMATEAVTMATLLTVFMSKDLSFDFLGAFESFFLSLFGLLGTSAIFVALAT